jgi:hypothetical protein
LTKNDTTTLADELRRFGYSYRLHSKLGQISCLIVHRRVEFRHTLNGVTKILSEPDANAILRKPGPWAIPPGLTRKGH